MCLHLFYLVQIPSPGIQTKLVVFERRFPSVPRNETSISVHFLDSQVLNEVKFNSHLL